MEGFEFKKGLSLTDKRGRVSGGDGRNGVTEEGGARSWGETGPQGLQKEPHP